MSVSPWGIDERKATFFCFSTRILDQWRLEVEQERGSVNPWSTTLTFQDRASKGLLFLMSLWKNVLPKCQLFAICISTLYPSVGLLELRGGSQLDFHISSDCLPSREVSQMHYKLSGTDFNNNHLLFKFLPVLFAITHTHTYTLNTNTHSKSKFIFQVKLILI